MCIFDVYHSVAHIWGVHVCVAGAVCVQTTQCHCVQIHGIYLDALVEEQHFSGINSLLPPLAIMPTSAWCRTLLARA